MTERENLLTALRGGTPRWVPDFSVATDMRVCSAVRDRYDGREGGFDAYGVHWTTDEKTGQPTPTPGRQRLADVTRWREEGVIPDLAGIDWEATAARDLRGVDRANRVFTLLQPFGLFERLHCLMGFEDALCNFHEQPEALQELIDAIVDFKVAVLEKVLPRYRPDLVEYMDDWGSEGAPFFSMDLFERYIRPGTQRIIDTVHAHGAFFLMHSDGKVEAFVPAMVEMGVDAWNPCQVMNDVKGLKARFQGRLTFFYGLDNQGVLDREGVTEPELRQEVRRAIDAYAPGGGFVIQPSFVRDDPWAMKILNDEIRSFGGATA
jgi:hypothetical protein